MRKKASPEASVPVTDNSPDELDMALGPVIVTSGEPRVEPPHTVEDSNVRHAWIGRQLLLSAVQIGYKKFIGAIRRG